MPICNVVRSARLLFKRTKVKGIAVTLITREIPLTGLLATLLLLTGCAATAVSSQSYGEPDASVQYDYLQWHRGHPFALQQWPLYGYSTANDQLLLGSATGEFK